MCFVDGFADKSAAPRTRRSDKKGRKSPRNSAVEDLIGGRSYAITLSRRATVPAIRFGVSKVPLSISARIA